jgi:4-amino-4-deoxy-L-arabinose transferase-like glycosyltransferase
VRADSGIDPRQATSVAAHDPANAAAVVRPSRWSLADAAALSVLLVVAAVLRFVDLPTRSTWDADQGHDMLVLTHFVTKGVVPLLGPPTSIGAFHHGALYYFLLAPGAWFGGGDPVAVVAEIALLGTAAAGLVWWIARLIGGRVAGFAAGLVAAVSATAIDESTFLWNPNLIAFSSALTMAAAWRAWSVRRTRWWLLAGVGQAVTMQCHVLGATFLVPLLGLIVADARRRAPGERRPVALAGLGFVAIVVVSYVPLAIHELGHDFAETRAAVAFLTGGGQQVAIDPLTRLVFVGLRVLAWPLTGLITDAPLAGILAAVFVLAVLIWRLRAATGLERTFVRWTAGTLGWCWIVLGFGVGGLATVTPLPVDHYHAFLDPLVFIVAGLGIGALWRRGTASDAPRPASLVPRVAAVTVTVALVAFQLGTWPPASAPDGGWPGADAAATRIQAAATPGPIAVVSLPPFKTPEAYTFPLVRAGRPIAQPAAAGTLVVVCDALFVANCGGPAEAAAVSGMDGGWATVATSPVDRFEAAPDRTISVYRR